MGWSQVVHLNRKKAELSRAREELRKRKRCYDIEVSANAGLPAVTTLLGALAGGVWWKREGRKLHGRDWRNIPGMQQLLALLTGGKQPSRTPARGNAKPKQSAKAAVLKAAALKPASSSGSSAASRQQPSVTQAAAPPAPSVQRQVRMTGAPPCVLVFIGFAGDYICGRGTV